MKTLKLLMLLTGLTLLSFYSCKKSYSGNNNNTSSYQVSLINMSFNPSSMTVKAGSTVIWTNNDNLLHTVTADDNSFTSGDMSKSNTFSHTFNSTGTFPYHCNYHSTMTATITVN